MDAQQFPTTPALDGSKLFKELKSQKILQSFANISAGLEEQSLNPLKYAAPWLQALSTIPPRARDPNPLLNPPTLSHLHTHPRSTKCTFETHTCPPQYSWCTLIDRNIYPKKSLAKAAEKLELDTIRAVPYYDVHDNNRRQSPLATLCELKKAANEAKWKICLDGRISPDVFRQNFYWLIAAFNVDSVENLCEILKLPGQAPSRTASDKWFFECFAQAISKEIDSDYNVVLNSYSEAWAELKASGRLERIIVSLDAGSNLTITEIICNFRLTLPAKKRLMFKDTAFRYFHVPSHEDKLCGICKQFYCEGHYDKRIQTPVISMSTRERTTNPPCCGSDCSQFRTADWINQELENHESLKYSQWDHQSKSLLQTIKKATGPERNSACDLVFFFENPSRPCWQIWAAWQTLISKSDKDEPEPAKPKPKAKGKSKTDLPGSSSMWEPRSYSLPSSYKPAETDGYIRCWHTGSCFENKACDCYKLKTFCDRFCRCSPACKRRYKGCLCVKKCDKNCECVKKFRECDPLICKCRTCDHAKPDPTSQSLRHDCGNFQIARKKKRTFVAPSIVSGLGLFAGETISAGDYFGDYTGVLLRAEDIELQSVLTTISSNSYLFDLNKTDMIDAAKFGNRSRFINEPPEGRQQNASGRVWYVGGTQVIRFFAERKIDVGKEIFIDYGSAYHIRDY